MYKITSRVSVITAMGIATALGIGGAFVALRNTTQAQNKETASASVTPQPTGDADAGAVVFIDPATGQIRQPEAAEIGALRSQATARARGKGEIAPQPFAVQGGGVGLALDPSFDVSIVVTKEPNGKLKTDCVVGQEAANAIVTSEGTTTTKEENTLDEK